MTCIFFHSGHDYSLYIYSIYDRHREGSVILNDQTNRKNSSGCNGLLLEIGFDFNTLIS